MNQDQFRANIYKVLQEVSVGSMSISRAQRRIVRLARRVNAAQPSVQADACYCCREKGGCEEACSCWQKLPEESRR